MLDSGNATDTVVKSRLTMQNKHINMLIPPTNFPAGTLKGLFKFGSFALKTKNEIKQIK